jgi:polysaccharide biosynthesis/export protein
MRRLLSIALLLATLGLPLVAASQVPSQDQLELLRSMSPEDREALLEALGGDESEGTRDDGDAREGNGDRQRERRDRRNPLELDRDRDGESERLLGVDALKPEDTIIVDIAFIKDKPPRVENVGEGIPPLQIPGEPAPVLEPEEEARLGELIETVKAKNPFQLDRNGMLALPGFAPILLAGLDEELATKRLSAVPAFAKLEVKVTRLPLMKVGAAALKPFGYDLFRSAPSTFAPMNNVPVPADYVVGPGDRLTVQLYGSQNRTLRLTVSRDGTINFPELGPIAVGGRTFNQVSADLEGRVARQKIGVRASISMADTRSIRVFVLGEANKPGSYTISGLGTITSALFAAGGVKPIGSLRRIQLKRQGQVVRELDLYDMLIRGDTADDAKLLPGDAVFVPPIAATVVVDGEVHRPAIYELRGEVSIADAIELAGGFTSEADPGRAAVVRLDERRARVVVDVPMLEEQGRRMTLRNGDSVRVLRLRPTLDSGVVVEGHVFRPGPFAWQEGLRISQVLPSIDELRPDADINYVLIRREIPADQRIEVLSANLAAALRAPGSAADVVLRPRDRLIVLGLDSGRREIIEPLLESLKRQSRLDQASELVRVDGRVKAAGEYPLEPGMRVSDLLRAGGGLQDAAYSARAEITRYRVGSDMRRTELIDIDLAAILRGDRDADLKLLPFDFLNIKEVPEWGAQDQVTLRGEVRFPGTYPIQRGETLKSVLARAGGLTSLAFTRGSIFTRTELKTREQQQLDTLAERLKSDLAVAALQGVQANQAASSQALQVGESLLTQLKTTRAVGRLVIDLDRVNASELGSPDDIALRDGDALVVPKLKQEVTVIGEVQTSTSHLYRDNFTRDDYVELSGGVTRKADRSQIYVVRADGSVVAGEGRGWFRRSGQLAMRPGDTVVVPLNTERMPALPLWQAVTNIVYNLAIAAAAVNSF